MRIHLKGTSNLLLVGVVAICTAVFGCESKETKFIELRKLRFELDADSTTNGQLAEYFIVENCPKDTAELIKRIQEFNKRTLNKDKIEQKKPSFYTRYFYKESNSLTRYYDEGEDFISDVIEDHIDDLIATVEYRKENEWMFKVKISNKPDNWMEYPL